MIATAGLFSWQLFSDLRKALPNDENTWRPAVILIAPILALILSIGHSEVLNVAMGVDNVAVNFLVIAAIFLIDYWRRRGGNLPLAAAFVTAGLASLISMLQGALTWLAMVFAF
jgi:hypothetical protein